MSSRRDGTAAGIIAGLVSFIVFGYVEVHTVPGLIEQLIFHGDPSAGLPLGFWVIGAAVLLIPVNVAVAALIGNWVYRTMASSGQKRH